MSVKNKLSLIALKYNNFFRKKPLVLNLELSHGCNLNCKYCGRIKDDVKGKLEFAEIVKAIDLVDAPIVYFTGGEPFLFVDKLMTAVNYALRKKKVVIIVTNGTLLKEKLKDFEIHDKKNLVLMFSVDGLKKNNDAIKGEGNFDKMKEGMEMAKKLGYNIWLNFTLYYNNVNDLEKLIKHFKDKVDRFHLNMYFDFTEDTPAIEKDLKKVADKAMKLKKKYKNILNPNLYFKMWQGVKLDCTPWGTVTLDPKGWRSPCYFICKEHFASYKELMKETEWEEFEKKKDYRCENCMAHCGFEPTIYRKKGLLVKEMWSRIR